MSEQDKYETLVHDEHCLTDPDLVAAKDCPCRAWVVRLINEAVAAALRGQGLEIERLQLQLERFKQLDAIEIGQLQTSLAHINDDCLRAEQERDKFKARLAATRRINEQLIAGNDKLEAQLGEAEKRGMEQAWEIANAWCGDAARAIRRAISESAATAQPCPSDADSREVSHGYNCKKVEHGDRAGFLHTGIDDSPYDVDGLLYCGRCHLFIDAAILGR